MFSFSTWDYKEIICNGWSWLSTWLYLEWTTTQNWKAHLWSRSWGWEIQVSDLGMEILRHSGYESQETKARRSLSSRLAWNKTGKSQIQAWWYTPLIWATPSAGDLHKDIGRRKIHSLLHLLALWDWATASSLDFHSQLLLTIVGSWTTDCKSSTNPLLYKTTHKFCDSREP